MFKEESKLDLRDGKVSQFDVVVNSSGSDSRKLPRIAMITIGDNDSAVGNGAPSPSHSPS